MTRKVVISTLIATALLTNTLSAQDKKKPMPYKQEKKLAKKTIKGLLKNFKTNFKKAMKKGGPVGATDFCSQNAEKITDDYNKNLKNITIKRVTLKPRNEKNLAKADEASILEALKTLQDNKVQLPKMLVKKVDDKHVKVIKPITVKAKCLICHGSDKQLDKKAFEAIKAKYPNDKATGYKVGDLRGAFIVDIVKGK